MPVSNAAPGGLSEPALKLRTWGALLVGYFALQVVVRTLLSPSADLDETDQMTLTQLLSWGYGPQPPLYTWIQIGFFKVFGQGIFALSLFKNLLLCGTYLLTYATARALTGSRLCGLAGAWSLLLLPQVAWESQRDLTHSVLAAFLAMATLFCFVRTHQSRHLRWYLLLGVSAGLGLISKYNYCLWLLGLLLAGASLAEFRPTVLRRPMLLSVGLALVIFLPNGLWILQHRDLAFLTASKFEIQTAQPWGSAVGRGLLKLAEAELMFALPLALVYAAMCFEKPARALARPGAEYARLMGRALVIISSLLVLCVVGFKVTGFRDRWFQPVLICTPVLAVAMCRNRLGSLQLRFLQALGLTVMGVVLVAMPSRILWAEPWHREEPLNRPYSELAAQLAPLLPADTLLVADSRVLGGNLRLQFPQYRAILPEIASLFPRHEAHCVLVWDATGKAALPRELRAWAETQAKPDWSRLQPQYLSATYKFHHQRQLRLGVLQLD